MPAKKTGKGFRKFGTTGVDVVEKTLPDGRVIKVLDDPSVKYGRVDVPKLIDEYLDKCEAEGEVPYVEEIIGRKYLDISYQTWENWKKRDPEIKQAADKLINQQKLMLMRGGIKNKLNVVGTIFQLKVNHGMIETEKRLQQSESKLVIEWKASDNDNNRLNSPKKTSLLSESVPEDGEIVE